ncbi:GntR family transcriptional regulator [Granulosicoccus antarcticus]|uniref:HTH-type transcriptional repressor RspR n=1 Tax=Granulosicoccus antarcticus IMCC3135 TaxID=1192854 RepID=A0A2Z2NRU7_9GAMM|nr:GntR family transcriptional regulator [Granulosicoccus antarcticus]ASJ74182.1 HTH-type transcriptional repressor RspR [Granulosicoccus antarcticus IMCC3135]
MAIVTTVAKAEKNRKSGGVLEGMLSPAAPVQGGQTQDERLYNEILDAILDHRLSPGVKLKEDELADIFSVSRTVVRRALLRLSHDRIVDMQPNRGATIIRPDVRKAREILGVRKLIEAEVVREATLNATPESLNMLRRCVEDERDHVRRQQQGAGLRLSGDFHIQLSALSENTTLMSYLKELVPQTSLIIAMYQIPHHDLCSHQEHFDILDVMASGDAQAAVASMSAHLQHLEDKLDLDNERSPGDLYAAFAHVRTTAD